MPIAMPTKSLVMFILADPYLGSGDGCRNNKVDLEGDSQIGQTPQERHITRERRDVLEGMGARGTNCG